MARHSHRASGFLAAMLLLSGTGAAAGDRAGGIDTDRLSNDIRVLASDAFEGREPGTRAEPKTLDYITARMKAIGLSPGAKGGWLQAVPLIQFRIAKAEVAVNGKDGARPLRHDDEAVFVVKRPVDHVAFERAPLVFAGYCVHAPEQRWDDFKGIDARGKIIVCLANDPDFEATPGDAVAGRFGGEAVTYYGRWTYKVEEASRRHALGVLIVHDTKGAGYNWNVVKRSIAETVQMGIVRDDPGLVHPPLEGYLRGDVAAELFGRAGLDLAAERKHARSPDFRPVPLAGLTLSARLDVAHSAVTSHNVIGRIEGTQRPHEAVVYTAHWDHLGIGQPDADGDRIHHGAIDNASGIAGMLEIARLFKQGPRPARSILFIAVTAEEKYLLGSEYYTLHPVHPLARTVAALNLDALRPLGPARDVTASGDAKNGLQDDLARLAAHQGRRFTPDQNPSAGYYYRSDHFSFAKVGVPSLSIKSGLDLIDGGTEAGIARAREWADTVYHTPRDRWRADLDLRGMAMDFDLAFSLGRDLANSREMPKWHDDSEFKDIRARSLAGDGDHGS